VLRTDGDAAVWLGRRAARGAGEADVTVAGWDREEVDDKGAFIAPAGALVEVEAPGSGGYRPPEERDAAAVAEHLAAGYVTGRGPPGIMADELDQVPRSGTGLKEPFKFSRSTTVGSRHADALPLWNQSSPAARRLRLMIAGSAPKSRRHWRVPGRKSPTIRPWPKSGH